jgi:hypothetical protein
MPQGWIWSPSCAGTLDPVTGLGRASLVCAFGFRQGVCLGYLARSHRFAETVSAWQLSSIVVRTAIWIKT